MFSSRNKLIVSYIDRTSLLYPRYRILVNSMSKGPWYFERSNTHILAVNNAYKNPITKKEFSMRLDNCDICVDVKHSIMNKNIKLDGKDEEYLCRISYVLDNKEITYVRIDKHSSSRCFYNEEDLKFTF